MKKILITAALPYINNVPHMGHIVGSHLPADIFYRYCIQRGFDATFVGGSDEHGTPSVIAASRAKRDTKEFVDALHEIHKKIYKKMDISYDIYSRTSSPNHHEEVKEFFKSIYKNGYTLEKSSEMYYSEEDGMFLPDRFVEGECPKCGNSGANGDQCEKCSYVFRGVTELLNPKSTLSGATPELRESNHIYIDLEKVSKKLEEWVESKSSTWKSHVYLEAKKWFKEGLRARSITRDMSWGVKVPLEGFEDKVFYVWFDAPIGYITFTREIGGIESWSNGEIYHFLGKDNIPFHTIFWPAMLIANGKYSLPHKVVGYNYLNFEGQKFSKSKGVGVFCYHLLTSDIDIDSLRFYLTSLLPENKDSDFKWEDFRNLVNGELIGNLSNFINRTLNMAWKNFGGNISFDGDYESDDMELLKNIRTYIDDISKCYEEVEIRGARRKILELSSMGNKYIDSREPWRLAKEGKQEELKLVLHIAINIARAIAVLAAPIIPNKMERLWRDQMKYKGSPLDSGSLDSIKSIVNKHNLGEPEPLYSRIDLDKLNELREHFAKPYDL